MTVDLFIPCFMDQLYPQTALNTELLLQKLGCHVLYNPNQTCCGQPAFNSGFWDEAKAIGQKFLDEFSGRHYVVSPSASCVGMVKNYYSDLFTNAIAHNKSRIIQSKIYELSDFIVNVLKKENIPGARLEGKAVYHASCASLRECKLKDEPLRLLKNIPGLTLLDLKDFDECCGFGGAFSVKYEAISTAMADQKVNNALEAGADYIISTDISCLLHLQGYIDKNNLKLKTMHIADVLTSTLIHNQKI